MGNQIHNTTLGRFSGRILGADEVQTLLDIWETAVAANETILRDNRNSRHYWIFENDPRGGPILRKLMMRAVADFANNAATWQMHGGADLVLSSADMPQNGLGLHADNSWPSDDHWEPNPIAERMVSISTLLKMPEKGGLLCFMGENATAAVCPEKEVGQSTWFTSDERNLHYVENTDQGARLTLVMWVMDSACPWSPCAEPRDMKGFVLRRPDEIWMQKYLRAPLSAVRAPTPARFLQQRTSRPQSVEV